MRQDLLDLAKTDSSRRLSRDRCANRDLSLSIELRIPRPTLFLELHPDLWGRFDESLNPDLNLARWILRGGEDGHIGMLLDDFYVSDAHVLVLGYDQPSLLVTELDDLRVFHALSSLAD